MRRLIQARVKVVVDLAARCCWPNYAHVVNFLSLVYPALYSRGNASLDHHVPGRRTPALIATRMGHVALIIGRKHLPSISVSLAANNEVKIARIPVLGDWI